MRTEPGPAGPPDHYQRLAEAFDAFAPDYAALQESNPVMAWFREENLALLRSTFPTDSRLLELGCGTGHEARTLATEGRRVLATDVSPQMVATAAGLGSGVARDRLQFRVLAAHRAGDLLVEFGPHSFQGAYASFGCLNCEPRLHQLAAGLHSLLEEGSHFVTSVINRCCPWEIAWYLLHGRPRDAMRRFSPDWSPARLRGSTRVPVCFFTPGSLARSLEPYFRLEMMHALGVVTPLPDAWTVAARAPALFRAAQRLDRAVRTRRPFLYLGDHLVAVFRRRSRT